jgi:hypothetical protein
MKSRLNLGSKARNLRNKRRKAVSRIRFKKSHKLSNSKAEVLRACKDEPLVLSERDSRFFISVMENPPAPSAALLSIFE